MQGEAELRRRFDAIPARVIARVKGDMERYAAQLVVEMKRLAPVETGALRDSIGWTWGDAPAGSLKIGEVRGREFGALRITVYAGNRSARGTRRTQQRDAFYAHFQEFGTVKMPANPFFFPVYRANRARIRSGLARGVRKAVAES